MAATIALRVLTSEGLVLEEEAVSVIAPGEPGYLGMLRNHAPLVTTLQPGKLTWRRPSGERRIARIGSGLLEVQRNRVTILTDAVSEPKTEASERGLTSSAT
ncbi:MAG: ATP synthase F1 subunit epsilon [Candidatus Omnitrophica bacterium]|nr:ATP synthase F1 subunit epsilon [Candidatus Omnitrophota bacterium]MBI3021916.1 ATP synthase F1 subunit epsilon [Candidatus Omnitrophota bacterium]MBI3083204.1 ATP synthase F1 subunit epsilon [Candidatus Omnitrophota bacterium]